MIAPGVPAGSLKPGEHIEGIVIEGVIAHGGHGPLYLARDPEFGIVAVKEYAPNAREVDVEKTAGEDATESGHPAAEEAEYDAEFAAGLTLFRLMGQALCAVRHPNLVAVRRCIEARGTAYLVMDHIEGAGLNHVRGEGEDSGSEIAVDALLPALLGALDRLHGAGLIHRDIKPANIRLGPHGVPILVDFGAALPADLAAEPPYQSRLTPGYAAPEQYRADAREGPWTDFYGLAAVAYRIVSSAPPPDARARAGGGSYVTAVDAGRGRYGEPILASIDWALSLKAADRPQSAQEWIAVLRPLEAAQAEKAAVIPAPEAVSADESAAADQPNVTNGADTPRAAQRPRPPWRWIAAAVLVLIALPAAVIGGRTYYLGDIKSEWIVDASGNGDVESITEAMATARTGATIRIRPGRYAEALVMARPLIVQGDGEVAEITVIAPDSGPCITITAAAGTISGLSFIGGTGGPRSPPGACVEIAGASTVTISETVIRNPAGAGLHIGGSAAPDVRANRIENTLGPAMIVADRAAGNIIANAIIGSGAVGILVRDAAAPLVMGNRIDAVAQAGILASGDSKARIGDNRIINSARSGIEVRSHAAPAVEGNHIDGAGQAGIYVYEGGGGTFKGNIVVGSAFSGVVVGPGARPMMTGNRISENKEHGILVLAHGGGHYQGNTIADNAGYGIAIDIGASLEPNDVERAGNVLSGNLDPQIVTGETPVPEPEPQSQLDLPIFDQERRAPTPPPDGQ